jgi:hypothetical protein
MTQETRAVLAEVRDERGRQHAKWGEQNYPDGTGDGRGGLPCWYRNEAISARQACEHAAKNGTVAWRHILDEEVCEAFAEDNPVKLRAELVQVAAVAVAWIEAIDRRGDR